jgi:hypothetical protein
MTVPIRSLGRLHRFRALHAAIETKVISQDAFCPWAKGALGRGPLIVRIRQDAFVRFERAEPAEPGPPEDLRFVACGQPMPGREIRIVDAAGNELGDRREGRIEFRGPPNAQSQRRRRSDFWFDIWPHRAVPRHRLDSRRWVNPADCKPRHHRLQRSLGIVVMTDLTHPRTQFR